MVWAHDPWTHVLASLVVAGAVGCGGGCGKTDANTLLTPSGAAQGDDAAPGGIGEVALAPVGAEDAPLLPVLNAAALTARVRAQRAALGTRAVLFEDTSGRPVPWIASANGLDEDAIDDDLLDSLPGSSGLGVVAVTGPVVNGNALGLFTPMQPEAEDNETPLARFYAALRGLQAGTDADGKVRVLVYGGSHTDADIYPHYLRTYLQERFGDGGHGFIHIARPWNWYGHVDMHVEGVKHWVTAHAQRTDGIDDGMFGLMGASLTATSKRAFGRVVPKSTSTASRYELYFLQQPRGGSFQVLADGEAIDTVKTKAKTAAAGYYAFELPEGAHTIEVRPLGNGSIRMFGMTAEREAPGVVVDTLGIGGTRAANMLAWDEGVWADNVSHRNPDLVVLAYGTNEATDGYADTTVYEADLRAVIEKLGRVAPKASCLLIGGGDFPRQLDDGSWTTRPRVAEIRATQRAVAADYGCGFWDLHAFMGGDLSMTRWASSRPAMAKADHIHFTRRGYVRMGMGLVDAMMVPFDGDPLAQP